VLAKRRWGKIPAMKSKSAPSAKRLPHHGVARVLSKMGVASRTQAARWVSEGRIRVNGQAVHDAEFPVLYGVDRIDIDDQSASIAGRLTLMLNKPRGLVCTVKDEKNRDTVYQCFSGAGLPWLAPVGRLDKASEGLLLFTNDPIWAAKITDPKVGQTKTYHVQVNALPDAALLAALEHGVDSGAEHLAVMSARCLRMGSRNGWLEIILDEGRNRQIRRMLAALDVSVLRLVRVAIGPLQLGSLGKGQWRPLTTLEVESLGS
jgi:23S rRNA pseudouridine2605 synthase